MWGECVGDKVINAVVVDSCSSDTVINAVGVDGFSSVYMFLY